MDFKSIFLGSGPISERLKTEQTQQLQSASNFNTVKTMFIDRYITDYSKVSILTLQGQCNGNIAASLANTVKELWLSELLLEQDILIKLFKSEHIVVGFFSSSQDPTLSKSPFRLFKLISQLCPRKTHYIKPSLIELEWNIMEAFDRTRQLSVFCFFNKITINN